MIRNKKENTIISNKIIYLAKPGFSSILLSANCIWLSIIWKSSFGWGILPVSSFDQTGTSLRLISNAPEEINCPSMMFDKKNNIMQEYSLFSIHQDHHDGWGWPKYMNMLTPLRMQTMISIFIIPCNKILLFIKHTEIFVVLISMSQQWIVLRTAWLL